MRLAKALRPIGRLSSGKDFFGDASHQAHSTFTGQEHAEAAHQLVERSKRMMGQKHFRHDEFALQHAKQLGQWARGHGHAAKAKGLPKAA
jgi:hypothetical protein